MEGDYTIDGRGTKNLDEMWAHDKDRMMYLVKLTSLHMTKFAMGEISMVEVIYNCTKEAKSNLELYSITRFITITEAKLEKILS